MTATAFDCTPDTELDITMHELAAIDIDCAATFYCKELGEVAVDDSGRPIPVAAFDGQIARWFCPAHAKQAIL